MRENNLEYGVRDGSQTNYSRPMVFKIRVTKGTTSFCLKYQLLWENGAFLYSTEINALVSF